LTKTFLIKIKIVRLIYQTKNVDLFGKPNTKFLRD